MGSEKCAADSAGRLAANVSEKDVSSDAWQSSVGKCSGRLDTQAIHVIAQSVPNLPSLGNDAAAALAPDAEYRIREIVQDALKFMRHAKRQNLTTSDVNSALRLRNVEPLYGFGQNGGIPACGAPLQDVTGAGSGAVAAAAAAAAAGGLRDDEPGRASWAQRLGAGTGPSDDRGHAPSGTTAAGQNVSQKLHFNKVEGSGGLFFVDDAEVNLKALIESPLPPIPLDYSVSAHWLAIDGVQPALPQNPASGEGATIPNGFPSQGSGKDAVSKSRTTVKAEPVVKPLVKHVLGKELQLYFEHVTGAIFGDDTSQREACLTSVAEEPGLAQLLPYFTLFIRDSVKQSLKNLPVLFSLMRLTRSLLVNPNFQIELYLHQVLPAIISCLVGKRLCSRPREDHWALRDFSAEIIAEICAKFSRKYTDFQPRITKTLTDALQDSSKPMTTHYGALVGLGALGFRIVDLLVIPHMKVYSPLVVSALEKSEQKPGSTRRFEAAKVFGALSWAANVSRLKMQSPTLKSDVSVFEDPTSADMDLLLPSYSAVFPGLHGSYGSSLFPRSACKDSRRISASIYEDAKQRASGSVAGTEARVGNGVLKKPMNGDGEPKVS